MVNSAHVETDPRYGQILLLISEGSYATAISHRLGIKRPAVVKRIRKLESLEYVQKGLRSVQQFYNLTPKGVALLEYHKVTTLSLSGNQKVTASEKFPDIQRLHASRFQLRHVSPLPLDIPDRVMVFRDYPVKRFRIASEKLEKSHWNQYKLTGFQNFNVYINRNVTEIRGIQVYGDLYTNTSDLWHEAVRTFEPFIEDIEYLIRSRVPGFRFKRTQRGVYEILFTKKEIAQENDAFAQRLGKSKTRWAVYDPEDNKPRFSIDGSPAKLGHGKHVKEIECLHNKKALTDNEKLRKMKLAAGRINWEKLTDKIDPELMGNLLVDLGDDTWNYEQDHMNVKKALALIASVAERLNQFATQHKENQELMGQVLNALLRLETLSILNLERKGEI